MFEGKKLFELNAYVSNEVRCCVCNIEPIHISKGITDMVRHQILSHGMKYTDEFLQNNPILR